MAGNSYQAVFINRRKDGRLIHCDQTITPLLDEQGEIEHFVCIFRDITSREVETQRYKDMVKLDILTSTLRRGAAVIR